MVLVLKDTGQGKGKVVICIRVPSPAPRRYFSLTCQSTGQNSEGTSCWGKMQKEAMFGTTGRSLTREIDH